MFCLGFPGHAQMHAKLIGFKIRIQLTRNKFLINHFLQKHGKLSSSENQVLSVLRINDALGRTVVVL